MPTVLFSWTHCQVAWVRCAGGVPSPWSQQTGLSLQDRPDHIRDTAVTRSLQSYVILHRAEKTYYLPRWQINNFYVRPRQHPVNSVQGCLGVWHDGSKCLPLTVSSGPCLWIWGSAKLFLAVPVPKTLHLLWTIRPEYNISIKISRNHDGRLT